MRTTLWPDGPEDHPPEVDTWLADAPADPTAEGCDSSPVGYLEGLFLDPDLRGRGLARNLVDAAVDNLRSIAVHEALGYEEVVRAVCFRKALA